MPFAGDSKLYQPISSDKDNVDVQNDLFKLSELSVNWQLPFSVDKCKVLHIGARNLNSDYIINAQTRKHTLIVVKRKTCWSHLTIS